ncbi:amidohydrolase [Coniella lustricola]|uniref:Amidohydrolase n=1 Tax=Coniella lustricola TaxID=2025994 RepID=A0A2T3A294_9PEZI|nr:amidohydrolase [Coniella lustricola]
MDIHGPGYQDKHSAAAVRKTSYIIINADLLIPGDGEPTSHTSLVVANKIIAWIGARSDVPDKYTSAPHRTYNVPYLMPGLWDVHVHFMGDGPSDSGLPAYTGFVSVNPATAGARLARGCWEAMQRGYTSLRDVAGFGCELAKAIADGEIVGPNIYSAGACLSQTAGHGDVFNMPADVVYQHLGVTHTQGSHFGTAVSCLVDGVDECRRGVRLQLRRGARSIKVLASGGVMSRDDDLQYAQFSEEELAVIVKEAGRQGRSVAAHVHGKAGILAAVRAGVATVEHISFADQECIDLIKEKGTICVPTRFVTVLLESTGGKGLEPSVWEKAKLAAAAHLTAYKLAIASGCTIAMGTDTPPGLNTAKELEYAVEAGMSNLEAIKAATVHGALTVGAQAPRTGQLKVGYEADLLGVMANPVEDVRVLQDKANIRWVWKGGKIFKGPGVGPWGEDPWWQDA